MNEASSATQGLKGLSYFRKARGYTQEEFALQVGLHRVTIAAYESGTQDPSLSKVRKMASALGCTPADLVSPPPGEVENA